jgi:hypothetical protein
LVSEAGDAKGEMTEQKTDARIAEKFRGLTEESLGAKRVTATLEGLRRLDELQNVGEIPPTFVLD